MFPTIVKQDHQNHEDHSVVSLEENRGSQYDFLMNSYDSSTEAEPICPELHQFHFLSLEILEMCLPDPTSLTYKSVIGQVSCAF